jgi:hypothetical protein
MPFEMPCPDSSKSTAACKARALAPKARAVRKRKNTKDAKGPKTRLLRNVLRAAAFKKSFLRGVFSIDKLRLLLYFYKNKIPVA